METFVLGNLNRDILRSFCEGNTLKNFYNTLNLTQLVTLPTRVILQSSSIINETRVVERHISNHYLTYIVLNLKLPKPPPTHIITGRFQPYDASKFLQELK